MTNKEAGKNTDRKWALHTPEAKTLFDAVDRETVDKFVSCYLRGDIDSEDAKAMRSRLINASTIMQMVKEDKTSSLTFEFLYHKRPVIHPIDKYFPEGKAARAIYKRLIALRENLPRIIRMDMAGRDLKTYGVLNIGSGPSHEMIEILHENPDLAKIVHVTCVEPDKEAIAIGENRVSELGLSASFSFVPKKLQDFDGAGYDMLLLIGILCPMNKEAGIKILKNITCFSRFGGLVVFSTVQNRMGEEDPLTDYIMRLLNWHMSYKGDDEPARMATLSGWRPVGRFLDEYGFNCMTVARLSAGPQVILRRILHPLYLKLKKRSGKQHSNH